MVAGLNALNWKGLLFRSAKRGCHLINFDKVDENHQRVTELLDDY